MTSHAVRLRSLAHVYASDRGRVHAFGPIDLEVADGDFVVVLGPSGCGKSTLLQVLAGFIPPSHGSVEVAGEVVSGPGSERGVVFQQPTTLLPWKSVRANVELGPTLRGADRAARRARAEEELHRVGLTEFADRPVYELSGGMQQRVQIARVLANDPSLMLMDEPFGALDAMTREHLQGELRSLWLSTGRTVLMITHSVEEAVALGTRAIVLSPRPGTIVFDEHFSFARSDLPLSTLLDEPEFHQACRAVRRAVEH